MSYVTEMHNEQNYYSHTYTCLGCTYNLYNFLLCMSLLLVHQSYPPHKDLICKKCYYSIIIAWSLWHTPIKENSVIYTKNLLRHEVFYGHKGYGICKVFGFCCLMVYHTKVPLSWSSF